MCDTTIISVLGKLGTPTSKALFTAVKQIYLISPVDANWPSTEVGLVAMKANCSIRLSGLPKLNSIHSSSS